VTAIFVQAGFFKPASAARFAEPLTRHAQRMVNANNKSEYFSYTAGG
jgi:hypothetical protein